LNRTVTSISLIGLLAMTFLGCVGAPCPDNDDAPCLHDSTGLVCNMAVPAADPENGTCQYPAESDDVCAENADCATEACVVDDFDSGVCGSSCCEGACMTNPVCLSCLVMHDLCIAFCCAGNCLTNPACQACIAPFHQKVCKAPLGTPFEKNRDCFGSTSNENTCYEAEHRCVEMEPGSPCDDLSDCSGGLLCGPSSHQCE
jgi:hypothetical protein